nr:2-dehydro-3-deoxygalactonokinase [Granulosicoccus sp.]
MIRAGVDWGSSTFRAYRFNESVDIVDSIATASGLKFIADRNLSTDSTSPFEAYLFDTIGQWLSPGDTVLLSGMVTSRTGWLETPYLPCPADLTSMMEHAVTRTINQINLIFLPGLSQRSPSPDVIRGEELQMLGASVCLTPDPGLTRDDQGANESSSDITLVMPGTHSKWAHLKAGCVQRFHTLVTGELFEVLTEHSLVGALATEGNAPASVF